MTLIKTNTPPPTDKPYDPYVAEVFMQKGDFDGLILQQGYPVEVEKAIRCACTEQSSSSPSTRCVSCHGLGWYFYGKTETNMVVQGMAFNNKYFNWTQQNAGMARVTYLDTNKLAYMDKLTLKDTESVFSEVLSPFEENNKLQAYTVYKLNSVVDMFAYRSPREPLLPMVASIDYTIENGRIIFADKFLGTIPRISVRYQHPLQFVVVDLPRDSIRIPARDENLAVERRNMPLNAVVRQVHYNMDLVKYAEF